MGFSMKKLVLLLIFAGLLFSQNNVSKKNAKKNDQKVPAKTEVKTEVKEEPKSDPTSLISKASYSVGNALAKNLKMQGVNFDFERILKGFIDGIKDNPTDYSEDEMTNAIIEFQQNEKAKRDAVNEEKLKVAVDFLEKNKLKEGVKVTASGLQYKVIKAVAEGQSPKAEDVVEVHYRGTFIDGTEFDSSYKRNQTAKFGLMNVIKGWTEGVQLMKVGEKFEFYIHPDLAYGSNGRPTIPPNSALIFEVELIGFEAK